MMRTLVGLAVVATLFGGAGPAKADHEGDDYDQSYGSEDDRNRNRDRERGAFSPGPFDRSPVTIQICAVPDSCPQNPPGSSASSGPSSASEDK